MSNKVSLLELSVSSQSSQIRQVQNSSSSSSSVSSRPPLLLPPPVRLCAALSQGDNEDDEGMSVVGAKRS